MFELSKSESDDLWSKISTTNVSAMNRNPTKVFTERGLYMLATILKGEQARNMTFAIIETFAKVRELKRQLLELHQETDKEKQKTKMQPMEQRKQKHACMSFAESRQRSTRSTLR